MEKEYMGYTGELKLKNELLLINKTITCIAPIEFKIMRIKIIIMYLILVL